jgi:UDP-N-acetyl-D-galactosamine dehydrogenase
MLEKLKNQETKLAIVGMGYVGLPLALEFSKDIPVVGFDINEPLIASLQNGKDPRGESADDQFIDRRIVFTTDENALEGVSVFIVAVPTPITKLKSPDLRPLKSASATIGRHIEKGATVIYESTVYPGCTEEDCIPIIERESGLTHLSDFNVGYSPERINPGDKVHTLTNTIKIVSGDTDRSLNEIATLYEHIIVAGVHKAASIKVAEAAKIIENTQRDLNIALMNELSIIFDLMDINTQDVIAAAGTKWNFLKFYPGLVGGHCIGVDPYYLTYKAEQLGYKPEIILSGRKVNDNLSRHVVKRLLSHLKSNNIQPSRAKVLVLGVTFKENVSDIRNSKVIEVIQELQNYNITVDIYDPCVDKDELSETYSLSLVQGIGADYDGIIAAVKHEEFVLFDKAKFIEIASPNAILMDIKSMYKPFKELTYWSL